MNAPRAFRSKRFNFESTPGCAFSSSSAWLYRTKASWSRTPLSAFTQAAEKRAVSRVFLVWFGFTVLRVATIYYWLLLLRSCLLRALRGRAEASPPAFVFSSTWLYRLMASKVTLGEIALEVPRAAEKRAPREDGAPPLRSLTRLYNQKKRKKTHAPSRILTPTQHSTFNTNCTHTGHRSPLITLCTQ